jgi:undecaprenyl diphosphate synthase
VAENGSTISNEALPANIPHHVAIIMDGNGRWAKARGLPRNAGHEAGTENLRRVIRGCVEFGVKILTIYAFSTENWGRPRWEIRALLHILESVIDRELGELNEEGVQLRHLGELDRLPGNLQRKVRDAIALTKDNDRLILNLAFNYGGRDEIVRAIQHMVADGLAPDDITEEKVSGYLYTAGMPDPDLIIRTSGEHRISNFLIWQGAYSEHFYTPVLWPDFDRDELRKALLDFCHRNRRFGKIEPDSECVPER